MSNLANNTIELQNILNALAELPGAGPSLPTLTNPGVATDLASGKELIDGDGNIVKGTAAIAETVSITVDNNSSISHRFYYVNTSGSCTYKDVNGGSMSTFKGRKCHVIVTCMNGRSAAAVSGCSLTDDMTGSSGYTMYAFAITSATPKIEIN